MTSHTKIVVCCVARCTSSQRLIRIAVGDMRAQRYDQNGEVDPHGVVGSSWADQSPCWQPVDFARDKKIFMTAQHHVCMGSLYQLRPRSRVNPPATVSVLWPMTNLADHGPGRALISSHEQQSLFCRSPITYQVCARGERRAAGMCATPCKHAGDDYIQLQLTC